MNESSSSATYSLDRFRLSVMTRCGAALRALGSGARAMDEVAEEIVRHLYERLVDDRTGERATALVRFYKTHPYGALDQETRRFARAISGGSPLSPNVKCLTLLASAGERPEWNSRTASVGHRAIPLSSDHLVRDSPMIAHLIRQFGIDVSSLVEPGPDLMMDAEQHNYNVFYVPEAAGSPLIPAQDDFVIPFGIRSVLGFGGLLPTGELFAVILFSKAHVSREAAVLFRTLSLSVKLAVLPFSAPERTFRDEAAGRGLPDGDVPDSLRSRVAGLEQLLDVQEHLVIEQSAQIERANEELARLASTDGLTGLPNQRTFHERLDAEHKRAVRSGTRLGLLMIDIDHFKAFNDVLGHVAGDDCLVAVAEALRRCLHRGADLAARYGGEEFAVILPDTDLEGVAHLAEQIRAAVEALGYAHPASPAGDVVTVSVGGAVRQPDQDSTVETLVQQADVLLYRAKAAGRNRVIVE